MTGITRLSADAPQWLHAFADHPVAELERLLTDKVYLGSLNSADPDQLLLDWVRALGGDFEVEVDRALAEVISSHWHLAEDSFESPDLVWHRVMRVAAALDGRANTSSVLWTLRGAASQRLGPMVRNSARDALGWYWAAISRDQPDDTLVPRWFSICRLQSGSPVFHGHWALLGLRRAPGDDRGGFRTTVASGLRLYSQAVSYQVAAGELQSGQADRLVVAELNAARRAYPFPGRWRTYWAANSSDLDERQGRWIRDVFGANALSPPPRAAGALPIRLARPDRNWSKAATDIANLLGAEDSSALALAESLLSAQRNYLRSTGDGDYVVRTLCYFAGVVKDLAPEMSANWAREAWAIAPENHYTWGALSTALRRQGKTDEAISTSFAAYDRFPEHPYVVNEVAESLRQAGRYGEAVEFFRRELDIDPEAERAWSGLALIYKYTGDYNAAIALYQNWLDARPDDIFARNGLAEAHAIAGNTAKAKDLLLENYLADPGDSYSRNRIAEYARQDGDYVRAEELFNESLSTNRNDVFALEGLVRVKTDVGDHQAVGPLTAKLVAIRGRGDKAGLDTGVAAVVAATPNSSADAKSGIGGDPIKGESVEAERKRNPGKPTAAIGAESRPLLREAPAIVDDDDTANLEMGPQSVTIDATLMDEMDSKVLRMRGAAASLRALRTEVRAESAAAVLKQVDDILAGAPYQLDALFTKVETFLLIGDAKKAQDAIDAMPSYLRERPEFLSLRGAVSISLVQKFERRFEPDRIEILADSLSRAGVRQAALKTTPYVASLRMSAAMVDGDALDAVRVENAESLYGQLKLPRKNGLASWYNDSVARVLEGMTDLLPSDLANFVEKKSDALDELDRTLVGAARYRFAPR